MSTRTVPRGTDTSRRVRRVRTLKVRPVSLELDETATHYLIFVSPLIEGRALGLDYHRARLRKCTCVHGVAGRMDEVRCRTCKGVDILGVAGYLRKLLRAYPTVRMAAEAA